MIHEPTSFLTVSNGGMAAFHRLPEALKSGPRDHRTAIPPLHEFRIRTGHYRSAKRKFGLPEVEGRCRAYQPGTQGNHFCM